jgi:hypothetical protein
MKLVMDDNGGVLLENGFPVYEHPDGKRVPFDAAATVATITRLNGEARAHREAKEAAEDRLKHFEGIDDPELAKKALETVSNIKDGELVAAGKVEEIKAAARRAAEEQVAATNKAHAEELKKLREEHSSLMNEYHGEKIGGAFKGSKFVIDKTMLPPPAAQKVFGDHFKVENGGALVAYDQQGNKLFSRSRPGEVADFEEAIELLVESYPYRDSILKGNPNGGGGTRNAGGMPGVDLSKLSPTERINAARNQQRT